MSNQHERKKATERFYLDKFKELSGRQFEVVEHREEPDFLLKLPDDSVIGLEVRMLFKDEANKGSPKKREEQLRKRFLHRVAKEYYGQGGLPAHVQAILPYPDQLTEDWIEKLAKRLRMARPKGDSTRKYRKIDLGKNHIATFYVWALTDALGNYNKWVCVDNFSGFVRNITEGFLFERIAEKCDRLPDYRKAVEQTILLLVAERTQGSGMIDYAPAAGLLPSLGFAEVHLLIHPLSAYRIA